MKKDGQKITNKDFEYFKKCCEEYKKELGLSRYRFYYYKKPLKDQYAECDATSTSCIADITIASTLPDKEKKTDALIKSTALHEVLHVLLARMSDFVSKKYEDEAFYEDEVIVNTLENFLSKN